METTTNTGKNQKFNRKVREEKCRSHLNHKIFSENFNHDPLNNFFKPLGDISIRLM